MKKLLAIILMLGISLPALAKENTEINLICTISSQSTGEVSHEDFSIYEGDNWDRATAKCRLEKDQQKPDDHCNTYESRSVTYTETVFVGKAEVRKTVVDRADGSVKKWIRGNLYQTGTCKPFEKKF
jgi:hypothetical protein